MEEYNLFWEFITSSCFYFLDRFSTEESLINSVSNLYREKIQESIMDPMLIYREEKKRQLEIAVEEITAELKFPLFFLYILGEWGGKMYSQIEENSMVKPVDMTLYNFDFQLLIKKPEHESIFMRALQDCLKLADDKEYYKQHEYLRRQIINFIGGFTNSQNNIK